MAVYRLLLVSHEEEEQVQKLVVEEERGRDAFFHNKLLGTEINY